MLTPLLIKTVVQIIEFYYLLYTVVALNLIKIMSFFDINDLIYLTFNKLTNDIITELN